MIFLFLFPPLDIERGHLAVNTDRTYVSRMSVDSESVKPILCCSGVRIADRTSMSRLIVEAESVKPLRRPTGVRIAEGREIGVTLLEREFAAPPDGRDVGEAQGDQADRDHQPANA